MQPLGNCSKYWKITIKKLKIMNRLKDFMGQEITQATNTCLIRIEILSWAKNYHNQPK
jgi:hypothetical protein